MGGSSLCPRVWRVGNAVAWRTASAGGGLAAPRSLRPRGGCPVLSRGRYVGSSPTFQEISPIRVATCPRARLRCGHCSGWEGAWEAGQLAWACLALVAAELLLFASHGIYRDRHDTFS